MGSTYSITDAQARFPALVREAAGRTVTITRRDRVVGYLVSPERFEAMIETLEILANPQAMAAVRNAETGKTRYHPLSALDDPSED